MGNINNNTTELQAVLELLQDKATGVTLPTLTNEGTAADLLEGKEFIDAQGNKIVGTLSLDAEMEAQAELIESIKTGLEGKSGGTSVSLETCPFTINSAVSFAIYYTTVENNVPQAYYLSNVTAGTYTYNLICNSIFAIVPVKATSLNPIDTGWFPKGIMIDVNYTMFCIGKTPATPKSYSLEVS